MVERQETLPHLPPFNCAITLKEALTEREKERSDPPLPVSSA